MSWEVCVKGGPNDSGFEVSVVRSDNEFGKKSYGWHGADKKYVSGSGGPCRDRVDEFVWYGLKALAELYCRELNERESRGVEV